MLVKKSIIIAAKNKAIAQRGRYTITELARVAGSYFVKENTTKATYNVDTVLQKCTCPAFAKDGFCKHYQMVLNDRAENAQVAMQEAEQADRDFARAFGESEWEAENL